MAIVDFPPFLREAFARYEYALLKDDVAVLDALFADGTDTIRSAASQSVVGHEAISAFRAGRGGAPQRRLIRVHVRIVSADAAIIVAESERCDGTVGLQTQLWRCNGDRWSVAVAHVSGGPAAACAEIATGPDDMTVWRVAPGDSPLAAATAAGPLDAARVAVKDLFAVAGHAVGAGSPAWLRSAPVETEHASAVAALLAAGAHVVGIAQTDELAFALAGANLHYGTPPNPAVESAVPGGSSSGSAAAVAANLADIGLATDTAGSIRVPASYCGLFGLRTTHGAVDRRGLVGLAASFDTVGVLTRSPQLLRAAADTILPAAEVSAIRSLVYSPELVAIAEPAVQHSFAAALQALGLRGAARARELNPPQAVDLRYPTSGGLGDVLTAFRTVQAVEAWTRHGPFVSANAESFDPAIAARFLSGAEVSAGQEDAARTLLAAFRTLMVDLLPAGTALAMPTTPTCAYPRDTVPSSVEPIRSATLRMTCLASAAGLPELSMPLLRQGTAPVGLSLVGGPGQDHNLVRFADPWLDAPDE